MRIQWNLFGVSCAARTRDICVLGSLTGHCQAGGVRAWAACVSVCCVVPLPFQCLLWMLAQAEEPRQSAQGELCRHTGTMQNRMHQQGPGVGSPGLGLAGMREPLRWLLGGDTTLGSAQANIGYAKPNPDLALGYEATQPTEPAHPSQRAEVVTGRRQTR